MSVLISLHVADFHEFHKKVQGNPKILICEAGFSFRILEPLNLSGKESRPLSQDEIARTYSRYKGYWTHVGIGKTADQK